MIDWKWEKKSKHKPFEISLVCDGFCLNEYDTSDEWWDWENRCWYFESLDPSDGTKQLLIDNIMQPILKLRLIRYISKKQTGSGYEWLNDTTWGRYIY